MIFRPVFTWPSCHAVLGALYVPVGQARHPPPRHGRPVAFIVVTVIIMGAGLSIPVRPRGDSMRSTSGHRPHWFHGRLSDRGRQQAL